MKLRTRGLMALIALTLSALPGWAQNRVPVHTLSFTAYANGNVDNQYTFLHTVYDGLGIGLEYTSPYFGMDLSFGLKNDGKYTPQEPYMLGHYITLDNGDIWLKYGPFKLTGGRMTNSDIVNTPYSLFISSEPIPAVSVDLSYNGSSFFYDTRWISLNRNSSLYTTQVPVYDTAGNQTGYTTQSLDRGMNYKVYGLKLRDMRIGFEESVLYLNQEFYPEYFFSPLPMYFTQLVNMSSSGNVNNPPAQNGNENSMMGLFIDNKSDNWYWYGQFLADDLNFAFLTSPNLRDSHPNKIAWSLGGTYTFNFGTLGFYTAGATKYTFEPTYTSSTNNNIDPYQYTYFPASTYTGPNGGLMPLWYTDNYIGYKYGENNLAFQVTYSNTIDRFDMGGSLEYVISGSVAPADAWQGLIWYPGGTELLNQSPLQHQITLTGTASRTFFKSLTVSASLMVGYVANQLELSNVPNPYTSGEAMLFAPGSRSAFLYSASLGVKYQYSSGW